MATRLDIKDLREYLIDLYERFLRGEDIRAEARKVFEDYMGSYKFTSENVTEAIGLLEDIGWEIPKEVSHLTKTHKELAKEILNSLKKESLNPPKEWFREVYEGDKK